MSPKSKLFYVVSFLPLFVFCQKINFGIKGGLNLSNDKFEVSTLGNPINIITEIKPSYHFGDLVEFLMTDKKTHFQIEVLYTGNGTSIRESDLSKATDVKLTQIAIPFLAKFDATEDWSLTTGYYFGHIISAVEKDRFSGSSDAKTDFQIFDFVLLMGFEFKVNTKLFFDLSFNYGLPNFNNSTAFEENKTERVCKNRTVNYGVVYKF